MPAEAEEAGVVVLGVGLAGAVAGGIDDDGELGGGRVTGHLYLQEPEPTAHVDADACTVGAEGRHTVEPSHDGAVAEGGDTSLDID